MPNAELEQEFFDTSFEQQFTVRKRLDLPQGDVDIVSVETQDLVDPTPILIAQGWSENQDTYKKSLDVIAGEGRRGLTVSFVGRGKAEGEMEDTPEVELRRAEAIIASLQAKGIERTDAIFHSEGAISGLIAATLHPEMFRNIVLDKPSGMIGVDGNLNLIGRFVKLLAQERTQRKFISMSDPTNSVSSIARTALYLLKHRELFTELTGITKPDITGLMHDLYEKDLRFSIISGPDDPLYPTKRHIEHMRDAKERRGKNLPIEGFYSVDGGHNEMTINADKHTALAVDALKNLQRRRERIAKDNGTYVEEETAEETRVNKLFPLQSMELPHGLVAFRDVVPESFREHGDIPLVTLIGMGMKNQDVGKFVTQGIYESGQHVIPVDIIGEGPFSETTKGRSQELERQAQLFADFLAELPQEKVDVVGTSMSAITVLSMLEIRPEMKEKIGKVILTQPMGLGGKDNLLSLAIRQFKEIRRDKKVVKSDERQEINEMVGANLKHFGKKHRGRQWRELRGIASSDMFEVLEELNEQGVDVAVMQGELDLLNSYDRVMKRMGDNPPVHSIGVHPAGHEMYGPKDFAREILAKRDEMYSEKPYSNFS